MRKRHFIIVFLFCVLFAFTSVQDATAEPSELRFDNTYSGPYADKVLYEIITNENNRVQALLDDQIDILSGPIGNSYISTLDAASDIELSPILRNGYGHLTINCRDAPLNWTTLRKAFAFAYDKIKVQTDIFQGYSQLVDSLVPYANNLFSIEEDLEYHYYSSEVTIGNNLLDAAGFDIDPITGYRYDPNGNPIHIEITYSASSPTIAGGCAQIGADALQSLHIDAAINAVDFNTFISTMNNHGAYDMIVYATNFYDFDVEWLANEYWSGNADQPFMNPFRQ